MSPHPQRRRRWPRSTARALAPWLLGVVGAACGTGSATVAGSATSVPQAASAGSSLVAASSALAAPPRAADTAGSAASAAATASAADAGASGDDGGAASPISELEQANARWLPACAAGAKPGAVPVIKRQEPSVGFPFETVRAMLIRAARAPIEACGKEARGRAPDLNGTVLVRFKLPNGGALEQVEVVRGVGDAALHQCLVGALARAKVADLGHPGATVSNVPIVVCPDGRTLLWPDLPKPE
jgi:outer membrane biosynthesis protein TonB